MRVCFASTYYPGLHRYWGGAEIACRRLHDLLKTDNHEVSIVTSKTDNIGFSELEHYILPTLKDWFGSRGSMALDTLLPFDLRLFRPARQLFKKIRPDVVHLHSFRELTFSILAAAKRAGLPVVFSLYDHWALCPRGLLMRPNGRTCTKFMGLRCLLCDTPARRPLVVFRKLFFKHFLNQIDGFIVLSDSIKQQLCDFGMPEEKIWRLPLPLFNDFNPPPPSPMFDNSILFAGWMTKAKGLQVLIEAMPRVLKRFPDATVRVVETGAKAEHKEAFQRRIGELGIQDTFRFLGKLGSDEIKIQLQKTSMVAVPEQWSMAWPIFGTEAMAFAKPVAASRIGDLPWFFREGQTGRLFDPKSPEQLADCITSYFDDPSGAQEIGSRAQKFILKECDPDQITASLLSIYDKVRK